MLGCPTKPASAVACAAALHGLAVESTQGCPWLACGPCAPACQCAGDAADCADLALARGVSWNLAEYKFIRRKQMLSDVLAKDLLNIPANSTFAASPCPRFWEARPRRRTCPTRRGGPFRSSAVRRLPAPSGREYRTS